MEQAVEKKSYGLSVLGIFLILLGAGLLLHRLHVFHTGWSTILWMCLGIVGIISVVQAFVNGRRGVVFWGSLLFFISIAVLVHRYTAIDFMPLNMPATISLALGLAFLMLYIFDPRRIGLLIPVLLFCGYGVLYYLWWWDYIDWFDLHYYLRTYWPVVIVLWGISLIIHRR